MLYEGVAGLARVVVVGVVAYAALVLLLRGAGKRTLSKMSAFDLVITMALGSVLATVILSKDVVLAEGVLAFVVLISLQFLITWLSVRSEFVRKLVKAEPRLLLHRGEFLPEAMRSERVTAEEVRAAVRVGGFLSLDEVEAVILETDASLSVVGQSKQANASALDGVHGANRGRDR